MRTLGFSVLPMLVAADNSARTNRTLEDDYQAKFFKPTLINPGGRGQGLVFFDYPKDKSSPVSFGVIPISRLATEDSIEIKVEVPHPSAK